MKQAQADLPVHRAKPGQLARAVLPDRPVRPDKRVLLVPRVPPAQAALPAPAVLKASRALRVQPEQPAPLEETRLRRPALQHAAETQTGMAAIL